MLRLLNRSSSLLSISLKNPNPNPNLIRSVSGTPKGKGKLKDGKTLKRSGGSFKKKSPEGAASGGGGGGRAKREQIERLTQMADACLNAPTPLRHISAKDRERELQREKLGLISKDRQRELDLAKKGQPEPEPFLMGTPGLDLITLGLVDADKIPKYELTVEDGRRLAKEYSRVLMRKHHARRKAETGLLKMKKAAIEALPEKLREKALVPDLTPFPANRFMAMLTPPSEEYVEQVKEAAKKYTKQAKRR